MKDNYCDGARRHGHFHTYRARTGPAIELPGGYHTHFASFSTSFDEGHNHQIQGFVMATQDHNYKYYDSFKEE